MKIIGCLFIFSTPGGEIASVLFSVCGYRGWYQVYARTPESVQHIWSFFLSNFCRSESELHQLILKWIYILGVFLLCGYQLQTI